MKLSSILFIWLIVSDSLVDTTCLFAHSPQSQLAHESAFSSTSWFVFPSHVSTMWDNEMEARITNHWGYCNNESLDEGPQVLLYLMWFFAPVYPTRISKSWTDLQMNTTMFFLYPFDNYLYTLLLYFHLHLLCYCKLS